MDISRKTLEVMAYRLNMDPTFRRTKEKKNGPGKSNNSSGRNKKAIEIRIHHGGYIPRLAVYYISLVGRYINKNEIASSTKNTRFIV